MKINTQQLFGLVLILSCVLNSVYTQEYAGCDGQINESEVLHLRPKLIAQTKGGQRYLMQKGDSLVHVLNVTGTAYEMGQAYGALMKDEIAFNLKAMKGYISQGFAEDYEKQGYPKFVVKILTEAQWTVFDGMLALNYKVAKPYIPQRFIEEIQGISDGTGGAISFGKIMRFNIIPEFTKASCSIVGTWDKATYNGEQFTLRALDWDDDAPINKNPQITIYHSTEKTEIQSHAFANIGFTGFVGSITAVGSQGVSISEKHWIPNDRDLPDTYDGKPWPFVLRDLGQFGTTVEQMVDTLYNTHRTVKIHMGLGSKESKSFEAVNYSWKVLEPITDKNYTHYSPTHPQLDGVIFIDKHSQPSTRDACIGEILKDTWGKIDEQTLYRKVTGLHKTGDTQVCVTDVYHNKIYLSYSSYGTNIKAYKRPLMYIDLNKFFFTTLKDMEEHFD